MPEAPAAPASTAPASAPAAPAPAASAPASSGSVFDHLAYTEPAKPAEPTMDAPMGDITAASGAAPQPDPAAKPPEAQIAPANPDATKPTEAAAAPKMYAERFKTVEDLEVAYKHSSQEGRRLAGVLKEKDTAFEAAQSKMRELEAQIALGPEVKEPTQAELDAMPPSQAAAILVKLSEQRLRKEQSARDRAASEKVAKEEATVKYNTIISKAQAMEKDTVQYPDYGDLKPLMDEFMDVEPGITGHANTPAVLYYAAKGYKAAQAERAAKTASAGAAEKAKAKAAADSVAAGGTGPAGAQINPAGAGKAVDPNSDEAHNLALVRGVKPKPVFSF